MHASLVPAGRLTSLSGWTTQAALLVTTDHTLGYEFNRCASRAQKRNAVRKKTSLLNLRLNDYRQVYFSREDRRLIPTSLQDEIR
jgi:hypothetical protein